MSKFTIYQYIYHVFEVLAPFSATSDLKRSTKAWNCWNCYGFWRSEVHAQNWQGHVHTEGIQPHNDLIYISVEQAANPK